LAVHAATRRDFGSSSSVTEPLGLSSGFSRCFRQISYLGGLSVPSQNMWWVLVPTHKFPGNGRFLPTLQIVEQLLAPADRFLSGGRGRYPHPPRTMGQVPAPPSKFPSRESHPHFPGPVQWVPTPTDGFPSCGSYLNHPRTARISSGSHWQNSQ
jgi:hypothetical protein